MSLLVAILVAWVWSVFGFPMKFYQCWLSWSRWGTGVGLLGYFLIAGGLGGTIGWLAASLSHAAPSQNPVVNGLLYGFAGALAARADVGTRAKRTSSPDTLADAKSGLALAINWMGDSLDRITHRSAQKWLEELSPEELVDEAVRVTTELFNLPASEMSNAAKETHEKLVTPHIKALSSEKNMSDRAKKDACYFLKSSLAKTYPANHIAKPF